MSLVNQIDISAEKEEYKMYETKKNEILDEKNVQKRIVFPLNF